MSRQIDQYTTSIAPGTMSPFVGWIMVFFSMLLHCTVRMKKHRRLEVNL